MHPKTILNKKIFFIGCLILFLGVCNLAYAMITDNSEEQEGRPPETSLGYQDETKKVPEYVPGEILIKLKEGVDPQAVFKDINLEVKEVSRVHSIAPAIEKFKKDYKLEKDQDGWYWFRGKEYKAIEEIPDEELFKEAYENMPVLEKGLYRNYKISLPEDVDVEEMAKRLSKNLDVEYAYPNYIRRVYAVSGDPNDPMFIQQWALPRISAQQAWSITEGNPSVVIAVVDTGVDYNHEDLAANIWRDAQSYPGRDFVDVNTALYESYGYAIYPNEDYVGIDYDPSDHHGHGTHVAGIIAALKNNLGIVGIAPNCKIMPVRAGFSLLHPSGSKVGALEDDDIEKAILYAINAGANVINMSFGGSNIGAYRDEIEYAWHSKNVVLVAAAGNDGASTLKYPAAFDEVIAVAATEAPDKITSYSNYGSWVEVAAPGDSIVSTLPNNGYGYKSGTSMACPYVAGLAALIISEHPSNANYETRQAINSYGDNVVDSPDGTCLTRINAYWSCRADEVHISISIPSDHEYIDGHMYIQGIADVAGTFQEYQLYYAPKDNPASTTQLAHSNIPLTTQGNLIPANGYWDTTLIPEGDYYLTLEITDVNGLSLKRTITVAVDNVNDPPELNVDKVSAVIGRPFSYKIEPHDPDNPLEPKGQIVLFEVDPGTLPQGAVFDANSHILSWDPGENDKGRYNISFRFQDGSGPLITKSVELYTLYIRESPLIPYPGSFQYEPFTPEIYEDKIVFSVGALYDLLYTVDIYMYDITNETLTLISGAENINNTYAYPKIYKNRIVWLQANESGEFSIMLYDLATGEKRPIVTPATGIPWLYALYEDRVMYIYSGQIYCCEILSDGNAIATQITDTFSAKAPVDIYDDTIMWVNRLYDYNSTTDVYLYKFPSGPVTQITDNGVGKAPFDYSAAIWKNKIIWLDQRSYSPYSYTYDLYMIDLENQQETLISGHPTRCVDIYEDRIVYGEGPSNAINGNWYDIFLYDLTEQVEVSITDTDLHPGNNVNPKIYADTIVWEDGRHGSSPISAGGWIYMAKVYFCPKIESVYATDYTQGSLVQIDGKSFGYSQGDSYVEVSGNVINVVESWANDCIVFRIPNGMGFGIVKVVTPGGESNVRPMLISPIVNAPSNLFASMSLPTQIQLTWQDNSSNEVGFKIERKSQHQYNFEEIARVGADITNYIDMDLYPEITYEYRLRAYNQVWTTEPSNVAQITTPQMPPSAPSNLSTQAVSETWVYLTWLDNSFNETGFKIERKKDINGAWREIGTALSNSTFYNDKRATSGTAYYYRVCAYNSAGNSAYSNESSVTTPGSPPPLILLAHYPFESNANDVSGNNFHGTPLGGPKVATGIKGSGYEFDGVDDYISIAPVPVEFERGDEITISAWVKTTDTASSNMGIIKRGEWTGAWNKQEYALRVLSGNVEFNMGDGTTASNPGGGFISNGKWHMITGTLKDGAMRIYVDGVPKGQAQITFTGTPQPHAQLIGALTGGNYFKGKIDEVKIWNYALPEDEIEYEYVTGKQTTPNLIVNPNMEQGTTSPSSWYTYKNTLTNQTGWATDESHSATHSLKVVNTATNVQAGWRATSYINIPNGYPGNTFTFGGWSKALNVGAGALYALDFKVVFDDNTYEWVYPTQLRFSTGTHGWEHRYLTKSFTKPVKQILSYLIFYNRTGTVWFDDVYICMKG